MTVTMQPSFTASSAQSGEITTKRRRVVQNFLLIWLDSNIAETTDDYRNSITQLRCIVNTINIYNDADPCVDFLTGIRDEKVFMIVSDTLSQRIIPLVHDVSQLDSIYVFREDMSNDEQWTREWSKVKGIFTQIGPICDSLAQAVRQCEQDSISVSFIPTSDASNQNLSQIDQSFMYTQLFKEIALDIEYNEQAIKNLAADCRDQYADNNRELENIAKFERDYHLNSPIWWYTYECFLYPMLNRALRTQEFETIIKMGFFIRDLHRQIQQLHSEQSNSRQEQSFTVYRGQCLPKADFEKLTKVKGGLMSFNNFLSTSKKRDVSIEFARHALTNPESVGIIFKMTIDPSISSAPFALLDNVSYFKNTEQEILFSMHTVFRIGEIEQIDDNNRLWQVELTLTNDNDRHLCALTEHMRDEIGEGSEGWDRLGKLLIKLGEFDKAEEIYEAVLHLTSDDGYKGSLCHHLGLIKDSQGNFMEAISFYEKALEIYRTTIPSNHPDVASSYSGIGVVYDNMGEYSTAILFHKKALQIRQKTLPPNHPFLALSYNNIGASYSQMDKYTEAISFHIKAITIRQTVLPPDHPDLAQSYNNLGFVYDKIGAYSEGISSYEKALHIRQKILPPNHPSLATSYNNVGQMYSHMDEYAKALPYFEKLIEIQQQILPPNHPHLAISYGNIGRVYSKMDEYSKALSCYEKALEIGQQCFPPNHPSLATSYNNIGLLHDAMEENSKALSFYERALQIAQSSLPPNHPDLQEYRTNFETKRTKS